MKRGLAAGIGCVALTNAHADASATAAKSADSAAEVFGIQVVDQETGRGIPLIELRTVNDVRYYTDSAGYVAIADPGLMGSKIYFYISGPGYIWPETDAFGYRGTALDVRPGNIVILKMRRVNIAQRLYRITGEGIYSDAIRLGQRAPIKNAVLDGKVMGQDSALATVYNGQIHWIWGDTARPDYPLGNFRSSGATSLLPDQGGLNPDMGINLRYFTDKTGFCRPMCPLADEPGGVVWLDGLTVVPDRTGKRCMVARYSRRDGLKKLYEHGLAVWNDRSEIFQKHVVYPLKEHWRFPTGYPSNYPDQGKVYRLFTRQFPVVRAVGTLQALAEPARYQAFTCLAPGTQFRGDKSRVDRREDGTLVWDWKYDTEPLTSGQEAALLSCGLIHPSEAHFQLVDALTNHPLIIHSGSFFWNEYLKKWIMIGGQEGGTSFLGEIWFAAAAAPTGPWKRAIKIATHPNYSFYNPSQIPFFDQQGGRIIYFQGTYSVTFSGNTHPVPRYDYNQLMYRLDLTDHRLQSS
jgi:hypothetical protein